MWPRIELDIEAGDIAFGARSVLGRCMELTDAEIVGDGWIPASETLVSLSVRTGFDLLLAALRLPVGSEIIMSDVTIADMVALSSTTAWCRCRQRLSPSDWRRRTRNGSAAYRRGPERSWWLTCSAAASTWTRWSDSRGNTTWW